LSADAIKKVQSVIREKFNSADTQYQNLYSEYARRIDAATGTNGKGMEMLTDYSKAYKAQSDPILNNLWGDGFTSQNPLDAQKAFKSGGLTFSSVGNTSASFKSFSDYAAVIGNGRIVPGSGAHKGGEVDIDGKIGDPIYAFAGGKVIDVVDQGSKGYGKKITIQDAQGNQYIYGHLSGFNVKKGQAIPAGYPIGLMGNTGNVVASKGGDGSHLHIEKRDSKGRVIALNTSTRLA
jgi:murein DD-endopeptidase MepM/ murein hydrolase activator NlpD